MKISSVALRGLLAAPLLVAALPVRAQAPQPPNDSTINWGGILAKKPPAPTMPDVPAPPAAWPRLDPGAVFCRSEDDLARRAAIMRGEQADPADCQPINRPTAIQIVQRDGLGRTQVKISGTGMTGWTDAWLPVNPPPGTTPVQAGQFAGGSASGGAGSDNQ